MQVRLSARRLALGFNLSRFKERETIYFVQEKKGKQANEKTTQIQVRGNIYWSWKCIFLYEVGLGV